jgi:hypothetical protein
MDVETSLDASAPHAFCYGSGAGQAGMVQSAVRHHVLGGAGAHRVLHLRKANDTALNENKEFRAYTVKSGNHGPWVPAWDITGDYVAGGTGGAHHEESLEDPGIVIPASGSGSVLATPEKGAKVCGYYVCPAGRAFRLRARVSCEQALVGIRFAVEAFADLGLEQGNPRVLSRRSPDFELAPADAAGELDWTFQVPAWERLAETFELPAAAQNLLLGFALLLPPHETDVVLHEVRLERSGRQSDADPDVFQEDARNYDVPSGTSIASIPLAMEQPLEQRYSIQGAEPAKYVWLLREEGVQWQVRNAGAALENGKLRIAPPRSDYSEIEEIVIAPCGQVNVPFIHRLRGARGAVITPFAEQSIVVKIEDVGPGGAEIVVSGAVPSSVQGGELIHAAGEEATVRLAAAGVVTLRFSTPSL